jgi:microsomal dipeptidase-like Zn-dependent dipeptidase
MKSSPTLNGTVELHAHLFMKEGMGWLFRGHFFGPLKAQSWKSRFRSSTNPEAVERSGVQILVASLYAHPLLTRSPRDSIRRQIDLAEKFVATHPNWIIARDTAQARSALAAGKRVIILSLEGAAGIVDNEDDIYEFIHQRGVRIVTLLHLTDDRLGGVAFLAGFRALSSPLAWLGQILRPRIDENVRVNRNGLTPAGRRLAEALIKHQVWIDLSHASDESARALIPMIRDAGHPLLYTHTVLRSHFHAERGLAAWQLDEVKKSDGIIGLMPSEEFLKGGIEALATQYSEVASAIGADSVMMGSDYNGGIKHLSPSVNTVGLSNIGQTPELWQSLRQLGAPVPTPLGRMVDRFLSAWEKVAPGPEL